MVKKEKELEEPKVETQLLVNEEEGKLTDILVHEETSLTYFYDTDAFQIKVPRKQLDAFYGKLEKIQNNKTLNPTEKEDKVTELQISWVQKKMKPKRGVKQGEWWQNYQIFRNKLFDGFEFKHDDEQDILEV